MIRNFVKAVNIVKLISDVNFGFKNVKRENTLTTIRTASVTHNKNIEQKQKSKIILNHDKLFFAALNIICVV